MLRHTSLFALLVCAGCFRDLDAVDRQSTTETTFTLEVGDYLIIEGAPPRDSTDKKVLVRKVSRPATDTKPAWEWSGQVR